MNAIEFQRMCEYLERAADIAITDREPQNTDQMLAAYLSQALIAMEVAFNCRSLEWEGDGLDEVYALVEVLQNRQ